MPRVHYVKSARKDNPAVEAGQPYYWWKFRNGGKVYSPSPPRPSQLTMSPYLGFVRMLQETFEDLANNPDADHDMVMEVRDEAIGGLEEIASECQDSLDNMPEGLQYSPTGELLQERIDACESAAMELESIDFSDEDIEISDLLDECVDIVSQCDL